MSKKLKIVTNEGKVRISINIPEKIQKQIDEEREKLKLSRSAWMTMASMDRLIKTAKEIK